MKIAVLVTGEYRTFDHARKSMHFLDQPNIDVYFSTWDKSSTSDKLSGYDFNKDKNYRIITKKIINRALNIPATVAIQDLVSSEKIKLSGPPLIKTWYLGFDLIRKSGKKYDYVLLTRPDLYFKHGKFNFEKFPEINYSEYFAVSTMPPSDILPLGLDDHCFFTTYENMDKILSYDTMKDLGDAVLTGEWHTTWYRLITEKFKLKICQCPIMGKQTTSCILKFNCTHSSSDLNWDSIVVSGRSVMKRVDFIQQSPPQNQLFIFDLDGVLIDSKDLHFEALNSALKEISTDYVISYQEHVSQYDGLPTLKKLELLTLNKGLPSNLHNDIWLLKQKYTNSLLKEMNLYDNGLEQLFLFLKNHNNSIAVASNCIRSTLDIALTRLGIKNFVDYSISSEDVKFPKPNPEMFWKCMSDLEKSPANTFIIEDSPVGLSAAENSGANVIFVRNRNSMPNMVIDFLIKFKQSSTKWKDNSLTVLIPMAGEGQRFKKDGYDLPKPLINVDGKPMIQRVVENLNIEANYVFIVQEEHYQKYNLEYLLNLIAPGCNIVKVSSPTEGAACSTLLASAYIDNKNSLLIVNSDQYLEWDTINTMYELSNKNIDGGILTFQSTDSKWSYAESDNNGFAIRVAEKNPISDKATCGLYYWSQGRDYIKYAQQMILKNIRVNNEFYICPVYNEALADNFKIKLIAVKKMHGLGTPEDLKFFLSNYKL
jgi:HAD superfamily hydrolase (TIGR01509 family)